jgi:hypothetical protein
VLTTLLVMTVLTVLACLAVIGLYVVPFVKTVDLAERRGFSTLRFGAIALVFAAASALLLLKAKDHAVLLLPALVVSWAGPALLKVLPVGQKGFGRQGAHES